MSAVDSDATIRIAAGEDTWPAQGTGAESTTFAYPLNVNVYEPLIYLGSDYTLRPGLAESWEFVDGKTWRFHLRKGVTFHDGSEFDADDVMWSWAERQMEGQTLSTVTNTLGPKSVQKVDQYTVDFTPKVTNLRLTEQIVHPEGAIVPEGKHFDSEPAVGTGPFKVIEYKAGQNVAVERNEDYWGEKPKAKRLDIRFLPDPQTRIEALQARSVDFVVDLPATATSAIESDPSLKVVRSPVGRNQLIYINITGEKPHDLGAEPAVREAVAVAIDRQSYVDVAFEGNAEPGRWMAPPFALGDSADIVQPVPYDPDRAREVLDAAGWTPGPDGIRSKDGRPLKLTLIGWAEVTDASFQFLQAQLKEVGIQVTIKKAPDAPTYSTFYQNTEFDLDLEVPNQNDGNPAFLPVLRMYSKNEGTERFAPGGEFDTWAERALSATDAEEVRAASAEMMRILINEEHIVVPLAGIFRLYGMAADVDLGDPHPSQTNQLWTSLAKSA
ncbi:MAG: ABC transporter substrate-binding protein [Actinomycetota bacterium]|nr:ABC transporter substrate-binding protein [Actinomycetota bacterium]